jgi:hypothetical protein
MWTTSLPDLASNVDEVVCVGPMSGISLPNKLCARCLTSTILQLALASHRACTLLHCRSQSANGSFRLYRACTQLAHQTSLAKLPFCTAFSGDNYDDAGDGDGDSVDVGKRGGRMTVMILVMMMIEIMIAIHLLRTSLTARPNPLTQIPAFPGSRKQL